MEAYQCGLSLLQVGGASSAQRQKGCHIHTHAHAHTCCIRLGSLQSLVQTVIAGQPTDLLSTRPPILVAAVRHTMSVICASEGEESGPNRAAIQSFKAILFKSCMQWVKHRPTLAVPEQPMHYHLPPSSTDLHTPVLPPPRVCSHLPPHLVVIDTGTAVGQTDVSALAEVLLADYVGPLSRAPPPAPPPWCCTVRSARPSPPSSICRPAFCTSIVCFPSVLSTWSYK